MYKKTKKKVLRIGVKKNYPITKIIQQHTVKCFEESVNVLSLKYEYYMYC